MKIGVDLVIWKRLCSFRPNGLDEVQRMHGVEAAVFFQVFFFFLHVHTRGGGEIRTSDLRFNRRGPQPIELSLGDNIFSSCNGNVSTNHKICFFKWKVSFFKKKIKKISRLG
jgi:hypothetical protein